MNRNSLGLLAVLGGIVAWIVYQQRQAPSSPDDSATGFVDDPLAAIKEAVVSSTAGWANTGDGPTWMPALNAAENAYGIPENLLARIAYSESHFRPDIITGATASPAGALGLMQLMPQFFDTVRRSRPFTPQDTSDQIVQAAQLLATNYASTQSWPLAIAAYNAGLGTVQKYGGIPPYPVTQAYVASILADVPAANV